MEKKNRINEDLKNLSQLRLVGDNIEMGIYSYNDAIAIANSLNLDLVEISTSSNPPVCKILDYQKFCYEQKRKEKEQKAKSAKVEVKEMRFTPQISENDLLYKINHIKEFLSKKCEVKIVISFTGRQLNYINQGEELLNKIVDSLSNYSTVKSRSKLDNRKLILILQPKR